MEKVNNGANHYLAHYGDVVLYCMLYCIYPFQVSTISIRYTI